MLIKCMEKSSEEMSLHSGFGMAIDLTPNYPHHPTPILTTDGCSINAFQAQLDRVGHDLLLRCIGSELL